MRRTRVLLDANVIVDAQVRDLFCRLAEAELIEIRWSSLILEETRQALVKRLGLNPVGVDRLVAALERAFPEAKIGGFESLAKSLELPDRKDRHVMAAALHGECDLLVTYNIRHFPSSAVNDHDLLPISVDEAIVLMAAWYGPWIGEVVDAQIASLRRPSLTRETFIQHLALRAPTGAVHLGSALGLETYTNTAQEIHDALSPRSPHDTAARLLEAVRHQGADELADLVDPALAEEITGSIAPTPLELCNAMRDCLHDVLTTDGWGFGSARRALEPGVELIKLVRTDSNEPILITEPRIMQAHLFQLALRGASWVLIGLDGPDPALDQTEW